MTLKLREKNEYSRSYLTDELDEREKAAYEQFISGINERINLPRRQRQQMISDFNDALIYYVNQGLSLSRAMENRIEL